MFSYFRVKALNLRKKIFKKRKNLSRFMYFAEILKSWFVFSNIRFSFYFFLRKKSLKLIKEVQIFEQKMWRKIYRNPIFDNLSLIVRILHRFDDAKFLQGNKKRFDKKYGVVFL